MSDGRLRVDTEQLLRVAARLGAAVTPPRRCSVIEDNVRDLGPTTVSSAATEADDRIREAIAGLDDAVEDIALRCRVIARDVTAAEEEVQRLSAQLGPLR